jgi:hypothetical protein
MRICLGIHLVKVGDPEEFCPDPTPLNFRPDSDPNSFLSYSIGIFLQDFFLQKYAEKFFFHEIKS